MMMDGFMLMGPREENPIYVSHIKQLHQHLRYGLVPILLMRKT